MATYSRYGSGVYVFICMYVHGHSCIYETLMVGERCAYMNTYERGVHTYQSNHGDIAVGGNIDVGSQRDRDDVVCPADRLRFPDGSNAENTLNVCICICICICTYTHTYIHT